MKLVFNIVVIMLFASCATLQSWSEQVSKRSVEPKIKKFTKKDFIDQLTFLGGEYLNSPGVKVIQLSSQSKRYLRSIYIKIVENSELIFDQELTSKFYIIKNKRAFYFSLPGGQFYFSSGLVLNYLKNEQLLVAALAHEIVKSHKNIYLKKIVVPIGFLSTEKMLALTKVPLQVKMEINKWTFFALKRAGYDSAAYLNWLQTQNKNTLDFTFQLGNSKQITKEEFLFKNFIVNYGAANEKVTGQRPENSSQSFYQLINEIGRSYL